MAVSAGKAAGNVVILGPTASGKSALALAVAEAVGGEILSVDSMQVYRGMDIGTAKPSADEQCRVRHHLIDVVNPDETFTVARFVEMADAVIADAAARGVPLVITGGTPLYYQGLFVGLFEGPPADEAIRSRLAYESLEALYARLIEIDPTTRIHGNDRKRMTRALEVFELTGKPITELQTEWSAPKQRHAARWLGLHWEKDAVNRRINARAKGMIEAGWVAETRGLLERFGALSQTASGATGYTEIIAHLQGRQSLDDAVEQIKIRTRQLARTQMKWFRRWGQIEWIEGTPAIEEQVNRIVPS